MSTLGDLLIKCEGLVRAGRIDSVRKSLSDLDTAQMPRGERLPFANLCRRCDLLRLGLKILSPLVHREKGKWQTNASPQELAEYAVLLLKSGAVKEALWTLKQVDEKAAPEAILFRAFCLFNVWEYEAAVEALEYYQRVETRPYQRFIGRVNLGAALAIAGNREKALAVLIENIATAIAGKYSRLHANCLEIRAQVYVQEENMAAARASLSESANLMSSNPAVDHHMVRKWNAIISGLETRSLEPILTFRQEAIDAKQWESVRESDRYALKIKFDTARFNSLMFGTPYPEYRKSVLREHGRLPDKLQLLIGNQDGPVLDLKSGEFLGGNKTEPPSRRIHSLIEIVSRDSYRPIALGGLFTEMFPGEYFDYNSSSHRVHQVIYRARSWLDKNNLPLELREEDGKYSLHVTGAVGIVVPYERVPVQSETLRLDSLQSHFAARTFTGREGSEWLGISPTSFKALMSWALANGRIERIGQGAGTCYRIQPAVSGLAIKAA